LILVVTCAAVSSLIIGKAGAQTPAERSRDALDQVRRLTEVAAQKIETEVRSALRDAQRLMLTNPAQAVTRLKKTLGAVEEDTALTQQRRDKLVSMIRDRIRVTEGFANRGSDQNDTRLDSAARRAEEERRAAEQEKVRRTLDTIRDLQKAGDPEEARRQAKQLSQRHPDNPAAQSAGRAAAAADRIAATRQMKADRDRRVASVYRDIDKSAVPAAGDVEFDRKHWEKITKLRPKGMQLTEKEKAILHALNSPITVAFKDSRFEDVIEYLSTLMGQPIVVDKNALTEAQVNYETPITLQVKGLAMRTVLRKILGEFGLTYVVKDQAIQVTSQLKAKEMMVVRSYPIGDLLTNIGFFGGITGFPFAPGGPDPVMLQSVNLIIDLIQSTVDPDSWRANGGQGTIVFHGPTLSLVIRQSAEVHSMIGSSFAR
jgi:hypothetical protein